MATNRNSLSWKNNQLVHKDELKMEVVPSEEGLFRVKWPDGVLSQDHYNLTRAKDHCMQITVKNIET